MSVYRAVIFYRIGLGIRIQADLALYVLLVPVSVFVLFSWVFNTPAPDELIYGGKKINFQEIHKMCAQLPTFAVLAKSFYQEKKDEQSEQPNLDESSRNQLLASQGADNNQDLEGLPAAKPNDTASIIPFDKTKVLHREETNLKLMSACGHEGPVDLGCFEDKCLLQLTSSSQDDICNEMDEYEDMLFKQSIQKRLISPFDVMTRHRSLLAWFVCVPPSSCVNRELVKVVKIRLSTIELGGEEHQIFFVEEIHIPRYQLSMSKKLQRIQSALCNDQKRFAKLIADYSELAKKKITFIF